METSFVTLLSSVIGVRLLGVKCTVVQALMLCTGRTAHRGTRRGEGSASRAGRSLPPGKTLYRKVGGPQGRSGQVRKISPAPGFDPQTV